jgi:hypothetical protein
VSPLNPVILFNSSTYYLNHHLLILFKHYINASLRWLQARLVLSTLSNTALIASEASGHYVNIGS